MAEGRGVSENPLLLADPIWGRSLETELDILERSARSVQRIDPPSVLRSSHAEWESAPSKILRAVSLMRTGVNNLDSDSLANAITLFEEINAHIGRATDGLDRWNARCGI